MLAAPHEELEARARALAEGLEGEGTGTRARMIQGSGVVGGGTCPGVELPSWTVRVMVARLSPQELAHRLRTQDPAVVARVENDEVVLDLRTVDPKDDQVVLSALQEAPLARE